MASGIGYIIACRKLKTDNVNICHVAMLASVTVVDLLCTKYAVLTVLFSSLTEQPNLSACFLSASY